MIKTTAALACALLAASAQAQTTTQVMPVAAANQAVLRTGTPVPLKLAEHLTTNGKKLKVGTRFRMETAEPVLVNGVTVIPAGSPAMGEVTDVRNKGMWGKSGRINARALYVTANGRQIRLSGQVDDKGTTGTAGVVGAVALMPVAGFFLTGTSANIPVGTPMGGFIDEDVPLAMAAGAGSAAMVVGAPAPTMQVSDPAPAPKLTPIAAPAK